MLQQETRTDIASLLKPAKEATLIIGAGEVGISLGNVLSNIYEVHYADIKSSAVPAKDKKFSVIHICFPFSASFVEAVKKYIAIYNPKLTIIHSTVPVGTTRQLGRGVIHSPINGRHPNLEKGIQTFPKYVGSVETFAAYEAVNFFQKAGLNTFVFSSPETTELAKILCTTYYGWNIVFMKEVARICEEMKLPFHEIYTEWNGMYNQAYATLGETRFLRPVLFPMAGKIGGHCVVPNCDLLDDFLTRTVRERNKLYDKVLGETSLQHKPKSKNRK